jgi:N6-adenosine-specific RNA methylase IME4
MTTMVRRIEALPSLGKARDLLASKDTVRDVRKIMALAQAVASCEASEEARAHAGNIVLLAKARIGELSAVLEKTSAQEKGKRRHSVSSPREPTKTERLESEGISKKEAAECERIAGLAASGTLDAMIKTGAPLTTKGVVAAAKLSTSEQKKLVTALEKEPDAIGRAITEIKQASRTTTIRREAKGLGTITQRYPILLADPPWMYEKNSETPTRQIENQYPTMSLEAIRALDVSRVAAKDCVLFMWATSPKLAEAMSVLQAWGFAYRTCAVWVKTQIGMGYYWRQKHELVLLGIRGEPTHPSPSARPASVIEAPRTQHSAKPVELYEQIETMYPRLPKLEMFARKPRKGWAAWGNEVGEEGEAAQ